MNRPSLLATSADAELRRDIRRLRRVFATWGALPHDARGLARLDRIDALLRLLEIHPPRATSQDPAARLRAIEELQAWWDLEKAFLASLEQGTAGTISVECGLWGQPHA